MWRIKFKSRIRIVIFLNILMIVLIVYIKSSGNIVNSILLRISTVDLKNADIRDEDKTETLVMEIKGEIMRKYSFEKNYADEEKSYTFPVKVDEPKETDIVDESDLDENGIGIYNKVAFRQTESNLYNKLVHLDLKGAPPKLNYLTNMLPVFREAGATGLLIEYEDMFPYDEELKGVRAGNAYDKSEAFLISAKSYDFDVIPLIQTFGHLEFVLKLKEFRDLREVDAYPDSICPSKDRSLKLIQRMIDQVVLFHLQVLELKWVHLGCDEVYHIHHCDDCISKNISLRQTFVNHVVRVATYVKDKYLNVTPLIWDDMLRGFLPTELINSGLGSVVQPVVWIYTRSITDLVPHRVWYHYTKTFSGIWIASAFKGASGATLTIPNLMKNYENNLAWLKFATDYRIPGSVQKYNFQGLFLTGWSRYEHFSVLCETLPVSVPSLVLNLLLIHMYIGEVGNTYKKKSVVKTQENIERNLFKNWANLLKCYNKRGVSINALQSKKTAYLLEIERKLYTCNFKGNYLYGDLLNLIELEKVIINYHISTAYKNNGLLYYNVDHNSIANLHNAYALDRAASLDKDLKSLSDSIVKHLQEFFDNSTAIEFVEYKIKPLNAILERVRNASKTANNTKIWKNRPFL